MLLRFLSLFLISIGLYASQSPETNIQDTISVPKDAERPPTAIAFVPGVYQLKSGQNLKGIGIIGGEILSLSSGFSLWYLSDKEYDKYLSLPLGTSQEEFDKHLKNSEKYGTMSIISFTLSGAIYLYSVIDAFIFSRPKEEKTGFYLIPLEGKMCFVFTRNF